MVASVPTHSMIEVFRSAILNGGIGAAAESIGISQSSASRILAELQKTVGFQLFSKQGRSVQPTMEALVLMSKVQQSFIALEDLARLAEQLKKKKLGRLCVAAIPSVAHTVLPKAIYELYRLYPDVVVHLDIASSVDVVSRVRNRQVDLGFTSQGFTVADVESVVEILSECVCICSHGDFAPGVSHVTLADLNHKPFIFVPSTIHKKVTDLANSEGCSLKIVSEVSHLLSASDIALTGMGISIVDPFTGAIHRSRGGITLPFVPSVAYRVNVIAMNDAVLGTPAHDLVRYVRGAAVGS